MRMLTAIASVLLIPAASAQPPQGGRAATEVEADPLFHVELIVFYYLDGNRGEEDFRHGREAMLPGPVPELLAVPSIELESLRDFGVNGIDFPDEPPAALPESAGEVGATEPPVSGDGATVGAATPDPFGDGSTPNTALEDRLVLIERDSAGDTAFADAAVLPDGFRVLTADELELTEHRQRMARARPYRVLGHVGWAQTGVDTDRSVAVDLGWLGLTNPTGTVEFYLRRFRHVIVDLTWHDGQGSLWTLPEGLFGLTPFEYAESYRLETERNAIRGNELHYIDHPLFGMLIRITPAPEPEPDDGTGGDGPAG